MKAEPIPDYPKCSDCGKPTRRHAIISAKRVPLCGECARKEM